MAIKQEMIRDINRSIESIACDKYFHEKQYDEEGHAYDMRWEDCITNAIDDFQRDVAGWMGCLGYELSVEEESEISEYAGEHVNVSTIRKYSEGM